MSFSYGKDTLSDQNDFYAKTRQAHNTPGHAHGLTFSTNNKARVLLNPGVAEGFLRALDEARHKHDFDVWAYVVMPEHCHVLIRPRQTVYKMSEILSSIKLPASQAAFEACPWLAQTMTVLRRGRPPERRFWLPGGGFDRNIANPAQALRFVRYIHANPVKRKLALSEEDYPWSSAPAYSGGDTFIPVDICDWNSWPQ